MGLAWSAKSISIVGAEGYTIKSPFLPAANPLTNTVLDPNPNIAIGF